MQQTTNISSTFSEYCTGYYGFGFNGKEKDKETYGEGNEYDYGARIYSPRTGRWLSVDPHASKYPSWSSYCAFNNNPLYFIDPNGKGGKPSFTTDENGKPIVVIHSILYVYTDDPNINIEKSAEQIKNEIETELNKGFTINILVYNLLRRSHDKLLNIPIKFDLTVKPVSIDIAKEEANKNAIIKDLSVNFFYINNSNDDINTARGGNSGKMILNSPGKVKAQEYLHTLNFRCIGGYHWPDDEKTYGKLLMFGAKINLWLKDAKATQADIGGINSGNSLQDEKPFGLEPLNSIYNEKSYDSKTILLKPINENKTNNYGKKETVVEGAD